MNDYLGIVVEQCLQDRGIVTQFDVLGTKKLGSWVLLMVVVSERDFTRHVELLQKSMITDGAWYAHYFREGELVVVFRDAVVRATPDPKTWSPVVQHGLENGIPLEQLDFKPCSRTDAEAFFGLR